MRRDVTIAALYAAFLGSLGLYLPYFALYLEAIGLEPSEATLAMALGPLCGLVAPPLWGLVADRFGAREWLMRGLAIGAALAFSLFLLEPRAPAAVLAIAAAFALLRTGIGPMVDATALEHGRRQGVSYGRLRLWGSLGFMAAALVGGPIFDRTPPGSIPAAITASLALAAAITFAVPAPPPRPRARVLATWAAMLRQGELWLLLGAVALGQLAGAAYDVGYSMHLERLGHGKGFVGLAWGLGVAAEVGVLAVSQALVAWFGAARLLVVAYVTAAARWWLIAEATSVPALLALQPLHGVTFSLFWVPGVLLVRERAAPDVGTAAQGLFASACAIGSMTGMALVGHVLERWDGHVMFRAAAVLAGAAAAVAALHARRRR